MATSSHRFAELLTEAVRRIKAGEDKNLDVIQDELGFALGREGRSYLHYLRKGHLPATPDDLAQLAAALVGRKGLDQVGCEAFLRAGGHPDANAIAARWFDISNKEGTVRLRPPPPSITPLKPFVAGPPITHPRQFFGRTRELRRIFALWQAFPLEHMALVGARRSGKTSLLHYVRQITLARPAELRAGQRTDWLPPPARYRWIHIDFQMAALRTPDGFLRHLLAGLALPPPTPFTLERVLETVVDNGLTQPTVILLDELGAGISAPALDQSFWWGLRALLNTANGGNLAFLVAAHGPPAQLAIETGQVSPFFNMFQTLALGPFPESEARELIASSPLPFPPDDVTWIVEQSGRWPLLVQILCQERLLALELGDTSDDWQGEGLRRLADFPDLLPSER